VDSVEMYVVEMVVGLVEAAKVEDFDYLVVKVEVEVRLLLLLLLLFLLVVVQENWFDLAVAGDPQVVVRVLQFVVQDDPFVVQDDPFVVHSSFYHTYLSS